jgi:hypothetical protein
MFPGLVVILSSGLNVRIELNKFAIKIVADPAEVKVSAY